MAAHLSEAQLSAFRAGTLPAIALLEVDDHLAACEACRVKLVPGSGVGKSLEAVRAEIQAGERATHLTYEQIATALGSSPDAARQATSTGVRRLRRSTAR